MADFLNLQINSVHIAMYSMVGLTTAVLAYATAGGALESFAAKTMGALSPAALMGSESVAALGNLTPFGSSTENKEPGEKPEQEEKPEQPEKQEEAQQPQEQEQPQPENAPDESLSSLAVETGQEGAEEEEKATGGKKRRRKKTPKHRKSKKHNKSIKSKK